MGSAINLESLAQNEKVVAFVLEEMELAGTIATELGLLTSLTYL